MTAGDRRIMVMARAKLNLSLRVLAREASGFHQIETIFCAIELADEVEVSTDCDPGIHLHVAGPPEAAAPPPDLGPTESNLAVRAARTFLDASGMPEQADIRLTKRIPAGAGLGGGSSNAAAVLGALNRLHDSPLSQEQLLELGGTLGSDVPFVLAGAPLALAWGRGTRMLPLPPLPALPVLLAVPGVRVNTAQAYASLAARSAGFVPPARLLAPPRSWDDVARAAVNDFEDIIFRGIPRLSDLRVAMEQAGAIMARMTGSGSVLFGVFPDTASADSARGRLADRFTDVDWVLTRTAASL